MSSVRSVTHVAGLDLACACLPGGRQAQAVLAHGRERGRRCAPSGREGIARARYQVWQRGQKKLEVESLIDEGDSAARILHHAERRPGTLVALGSHGRTAVSRWRYGSVAEKILQAAKIPLLVGPKS